MARFPLSVAGFVLLVVLCVAPGTAWAQISPLPSSANQSQTTSAPATPTLDEQKTAAERAAQADLDRVKQGLQTLPALKFDVPAVEYHAVAYGDVKKITFEDLVGTFNLINGPVPYAGMTHQEFMAMSRPKELFSTGGITPRDMLQASIVNVAAQETMSAIKKSLQALREAKTQREIDAIRAQINRELAALNAEVIR